MLPSFLLIGGTKCGTTSLYGYLDRHSKVFMAPKELRYFTEEHRLGKGEAWYRAQFRNAGDALAVGEASNAYTRDPVYRGVPSRIHALLPEARLLYVIRDPWRRIESHYRHRLVTGMEWRPADRALNEDLSYLAASRYGHQLALYLEHYPKEQIRVVRSEDLFSDPASTLQGICRFIGVPYEPLPLVPENVSARRRTVPRALRPFARFAPLRPLLKQSPAALSRLGLGDRMTTADGPAFSVSRETRARIDEALEEDRECLARLLDGAETECSTV